MNKYQDALDVIDTEIDCVVCDADYNDDYTKKLTQSIKVIQELVDKETPKEMIITGRNNWNSQMGDCECGMKLNDKLIGYDSLLEDVNYCPNCGQKLDWSIDE